MRIVTQSLRSLLKQPLFTVAAVIAMAIGIGSNTAVFSVVYAVLLKPLPYADSGRILFLTEGAPASANGGNIAPANYLDYRRSRILAEVGAAEAWGATLSGSGPAEQLRGLAVTSSLFAVLGVPPLHGRIFAENEEMAGRGRVAVLSHSFWTERFGGDLSVLQKPILLNGESWRIVGIMPRTFRFAPFWVKNAQIFAPLSFDAEARASRGRRSLRIFARLQNGSTTTSATAALKSFYARNLASFPDNSGLAPKTVELNEAVRGKVRPALLLFLAAVSLVLLIACANVATLLLVKSVAKRRDAAIRLSVGATRARLVLESMVECAWLTLTGAFAGILVASEGINALKPWLTASVPQANEIGIHLPVMLFTLAVSLAAAFMVALVAGLHLSSMPLGDVLKESSRSTSGSPWAMATRRLLVTGQVAFSLVLLIGAGLLLRSLVAVTNLHPGFTAQGLLTATLNTWGTSAAAPAAQMNYYREVVERAKSLPGVSDAALINHLPLVGDVWTLAVERPDRPPRLPGERMGAVYRMASQSYFQTMKIPILRGRAFQASDVYGSAPVVVINEAMSRQVWPGEDAVGKSIRIRDVSPDSLTVVGIAANTTQGDWLAPREPEIVLHLPQHSQAIGRPHSSSMGLIVRAQEPASLSLGLQRQLASLNPTVPITGLQTVEGIVSGATEGSRVYAALIGIFALSALTLALIGLYALVAFEAGRRVNEMGIRVALGATGSQVAALLLRDAGTAVATGGVVGLGASLVVSHYLAKLLYQVSPVDPVTLLGVSGLFAAVTAVAAWLPARRVTRLDPAQALRFD